MPYTCKPCNYTTNDVSNYNKHCKTKGHYKNKEKGVMATTSSNDSPESHRIVLSSNFNGVSNSPFYCPLCRITFLRKSNLTRHMKVCSNKDLQLDLTKEKYENEITKLNDHINSIIKDKHDSLTKLQEQIHLIDKEKNNIMAELRLAKNDISHLKRTLKDKDLWIEDKNKYYQRAINELDTLKSMYVKCNEEYKDLLKSTSIVNQDNDNVLKFLDINNIYVKELKQLN